MIESGRPSKISAPNDAAPYTSYFSSLCICPEENLNNFSLRRSLKKRILKIPQRSRQLKVSEDLGVDKTRGLKSTLEDVLGSFWSRHPGNPGKRKLIHFNLQKRINRDSEFVGGFLLLIGFRFKIEFLVSGIAFILSPVLIESSCAF